VGAGAVGRRAAWTLTPQEDPLRDSGPIFLTASDGTTVGLRKRFGFRKPDELIGHLLLG
jgi:hypothetical protein